MKVYGGKGWVGRSLRVCVDVRNSLVRCGAKAIGIDWFVSFVNIKCLVKVFIFFLNCTIVS